MAQLVPMVTKTALPPGAVTNLPVSRTSGGLIYKFKYPNALCDNVWAAKAVILWLTKPPSRGGFVAAYVFLVAVPGPERFSTTIQRGSHFPLLSSTMFDWPR